MNMLRRWALYIAAATLGIVLLATAWTSVIALTIGKPATVKSWLRESGTYDKVVAIVLDSAKQATAGADTSTIPVNDAGIKAIAEQSFTPQILQTNVETALDGIYGWLEGETETPQFAMSFATAKQNFATGIGDFAAKRVAALPQCSAQESASADNFDAFSATCRPRGLDASVVGREITSQLTANSAFLENPTITADSLQFGGAEDQVPFYQTLSAAPAAYQAASISPLLFGFIAILCGVGIWLLTNNKKLGLRRVGRAFASGGAVLLILALVVKWVTSKLLVERLIASNQSGNASQELIKSLVNTIVGDITNILLWFAIIYIVIGAGAIIGTLIKQRRKTQPVSDIPAEQISSLAAAESTKTEAKDTTSKTDTKPTAKSDAKKAS